MIVLPLFQRNIPSGPENVPLMLKQAEKTSNFSMLRPYSITNNPNNSYNIMDLV